VRGSFAGNFVAYHIDRDPEHLASFLKTLAQRPDMYDEFFKWKTQGPSKEWIALMDLSIVPAACRFCIRAGDIDR
jgi:hypothetical protein